MALNQTQWKECNHCFTSFPLNDMTTEEEWFTINHIHDEATVEYDAPMFMGEMFPMKK